MSQADCSILFGQFCPLRKNPSGVTIPFRLISEGRSRHLHVNGGIHQPDPTSISTLAPTLASTHGHYR
jgi:hypothetical protein